MKSVWIPMSESQAMTLEFPSGWTEIEDRANLLALVAIRLRELILQEDEPQRAVRNLLETLENAGLIDQYLDEKALAKGERSEIYNLLDRPELESRLVAMTEVENKDYPLKPSKPTPDWYKQMTLQEWADEVAMV